jgi:hypothetical protein
MPGAPEGMAVDAARGILAVGVRGPDGVALVSITWPASDRRRSGQSSHRPGYGPPPPVPGRLASA